jgi:hypothetical protein
VTRIGAVSAIQIHDACIWNTALPNMTWRPRPIPDGTELKLLTRDSDAAGLLLFFLVLSKDAQCDPVNNLNRCCRVRTINGTQRAGLSDIEGELFGQHYDETKEADPIAGNHVCLCGHRTDGDVRRGHARPADFQPADAPRL